MQLSVPADCGRSDLKGSPSVTADHELVEVYSAMCGRCKDALSANEFSDGEFDEWPVIMDAEFASQRSLHSLCGRQLVLGDISPAGQACAEVCECQSGGLPERVVW